MSDEDFESAARWAFLGFVAGLLLATGIFLAS